MVPGEHMVNMNGCARCHAEGHANVLFRPLTHPVEAEGTGFHGARFTHWAPCPITGEPILMRHIERTREVRGS